MVGYKYFDCRGVTALAVKARGMCYGARLEVRLDDPEGEPVGSVPVAASNEWSWNRAAPPIPDGVHALYLKAAGFGVYSLAAIRLETAE